MGDADFSEAVKLEVKKKAAFRCCRCQSISVQVHHIIPQKDGGSDDIDNAAPLCSSCHDLFGANPIKRKEIRQMRDWWYERVEMMYPDNRQLGALDSINSKLTQLQQNPISLDDYKQELRKYSQELYKYTTIMINNMTLGTAVTSGSAIINASFSPSPSPSPEHPEKNE